MADAQVHIHPGTLPPFWPRSAIYFANLHSLFFGNERQIETLEREITHVDHYGGRLLPVIDLIYEGSDNLLVLETEPSDALQSYHRDRLKLSLPRHRVLNATDYLNYGKTKSCEQDRTLEAALAQERAAWLDGFVTDEALVRLAANTGKNTIANLDGSQQGNNKLTLHRALESLGQPTFETRLAHEPDEVGPCLEQIRQAGYPRAVVKSQIGASGIGMVRLPARAEAAGDVAEFFFHEGPCLVQGWLDEHVEGVRMLGSPSVQLFLSDDAVHLYDVTEQILSPLSIHEGNMAPPTYLEGDEALRATLLDRAREAGLWLHSVGYRGTASADLHVIERDGKKEVRVCELNARVTGATYPAVLARHFMPRGAWVMRNLKFSPPLAAPELLTRLEAAGCLYLGDAKPGILPINLHTNERGEVYKGQFLCLAPLTIDCFETLLGAVANLPVEMHYDRD